MKQTKVFLSAAALGLLLHGAAASEMITVDPEVRAEITTLVEAWIEAEVQSDAMALERILHKDFLSTFASGATLDRAAYIEFIVGLDIPPFGVINESITQHGDTVVVIDVSESRTTKFTWIAVRLDGQWKVISQTFTKVESPEAE